MRWRFKRNGGSLAATEADALRRALQRQRALLMDLRDDVADEGAAERTRRYVRERARAEDDRRKSVGGWWQGWAWFQERVWVYGGVGAVVAVVVIALLLLPDATWGPRGFPPAALTAEVLLSHGAARRYPEPPDELRSPGLPRLERRREGYSRENAGSRREAPSSVTATAVTKAAVTKGESAHGWQRAMNQVTEISVEADGSRRLRLRSENPNVVIYLLESETMEGATKEDGGE